MSKHSMSSTTTPYKDEPIATLLQILSRIVAACAAGAGSTSTTLEMRITKPKPPTYH